MVDLRWPSFDNHDVKCTTCSWDNCCFLICFIISHNLNVYSSSGIVKRNNLAVGHYWGIPMKDLKQLFIVQKFVVILSLTMCFLHDL